MFESKLMLIVGVEVAVLLLFLCVFLLAHVRGLKRLVSALEAKVIALRDTIKNVRLGASAMRQELAALRQKPTRDYGEFIEEHIAATRNHHLSLSPDRDIVLDITPDTPLERQAVSLRHAFLIAEKEAWLATEGKGIDWDILESKLGQIIQFYDQSGSRSAATDLESTDLDLDGGDDDASLRETIENQKRHIENLEKFKKLYFDTEKKWRDASVQAENYHQELLAKGRDLGGGEDFEALMARYANTYAEFGSELAEQGRRANGGGSASAPAAPVIEIDANKPSVGRMVIANQEEIQRLRNMAIDQHKMILQLRQQLESAHSLEEKDAVIAELQKQLERHERFLKESDICSKQLETELERLLDENHTLKQKLVAQRQDDLEQRNAKDTEQLQSLVQDFTRQSCDMLTAIQKLEAENATLRQQLEQGGGADAAQIEELKRKLAAAQQELLNLQTQHIELEERYLELKTQAG